MPNKIEALILLADRKPGAYVVVESLRSLILNHKSFFSDARKSILTQDIQSLLDRKGFFPPEAMVFPKGGRINIARQNYLNKSPVLGLIAEYLAFGEKPYHLGLVQLYLNLYFRLAERFSYSDLHYQEWLEGRRDKILGIYQSSLETAARHIRSNIALDDSDRSNIFLKKYLGEIEAFISEDVRSLRRVWLYCEGVQPKAKSGSRPRTLRSSYVRDERLSSYSIVQSEHEEVEVEQKLIEQNIPNYINSQKDLLRQYNKINGRANQLNRQNQLRALDTNFIRPAVWIHLDALFNDESIDVQIRALLCLSLISGRSLDDCYKNIFLMLKRKGYLSIQLNAPEVSSNKSNLKVSNTLTLPIPNRYQYLLSTLSEEINHGALNLARNVVKRLDTNFDVTPQKIARLFFFLANARTSKSFASLLFDSPLVTIATQLHYTVTCKDNLAQIYKGVFDEFEARLPNPQGLESHMHTEFCGVANFPDPVEFKRSLSSITLNKASLAAFLLYASENGSRAVLNQAVDFCGIANSKAFFAVVNDKKRNGAEHARVSFFQRRTIRKIFNKLEMPVVLPLDITFEFIERGSSGPLSPKHFTPTHNIFFKMNAVRKMRRSLLLNIGMSEELIDALNGHHYVGTVAISPQSSLSLNTIYRESVAYLVFFHDLVEAITDEY